MTNRASNMERAFRQPPDEGDFELTRGDTFAVFLFAPLYGYYVLLADLNMPLSVICHLSFASPMVIGYWLFAKRRYYVLLADLNMPPSVICHLSSVIRFALGYPLMAIRYSRSASIGHLRSASNQATMHLSR